MNLNTITEVKKPASAKDIAEWKPGYAWLAGGTWLFSEPQIETHTLIDLEQLKWPALTASAAGLEVAATCRIVDLDTFKAPPEWRAAPLFSLCCRALLASFKIWNAATAGGNICMSLPAGPMTSLMTALEGVYTLWPRSGAPRSVAAIDFITGVHQNVLAPGELLRSIALPTDALTKDFAFRRLSLTHLGRSTALLIGTSSPETGKVIITVTAATNQPIQLSFPSAPSAEQVRAAIDARCPADIYLDDPHGSPAYRRHLTYYFAEQIRAELLSKASKGGR